MASACVNNSPALPSSFSLFSTSAAFSCDDSPNSDPLSPDLKKSDPGSDRDGSAKDLIDFEFRLHDPVAMITADELFSDGKLVPLQLTSSLPLPEVSSPTISEIASASDLSVSSPRAPKCSSRWRELLGLKKLQSPKPEAASRNPNVNPTPRSLKTLLTRNPRSSSSSLEPSLSLPLHRDSDSDSLSLSTSRLSLSSTSSSSDSCDLPRFSLDSDKPSQIQARSDLSRTGGPVRARARPVRRPTLPAVDAESPRMNSSGKVVFYSGGLERSSSSPGSFNGGPRVRARGMERSFSANVVRVNPVLNVPVCSYRGSTKPGSVFGLFGQKKEKEGSSAKGVGKTKSERASRE